MCFDEMRCDACDFGRKRKIRMANASVSLRCEYFVLKCKPASINCFGSVFSVEIILPDCL